MTVVRRASMFLAAGYKTLPYENVWADLNRTD